MAIRVLLVCPHFPPVNRPDSVRVVTCLPHFQQAGAHVEVLTIDVDPGDAPMDMDSVARLPEGVPVHRVAAARWWKHLGIRDVGIRGFRRLYGKGLRLLKSRDFDVVFFSTSIFFSLPLGRLWRSRTGIPYVLDMQDPWYTEGLHSPAKGALKRRLARQLHRRLEKWTMRKVQGLISVSDAYIHELRERHPRLHQVPSRILPFPVDTSAISNGSGKPVAAPWSHVFTITGRGGAHFRGAIRLIFAALDHSLSDTGVLWVGSSYQKPAQPQFLDLSEQFGVAQQFSEHPERVPMMDAIATMQAASAVLILGTDDTRYNPSKIAPAIASGRPVIAIFPHTSHVISQLENCGCHVVTYGSEEDGKAVTRIKSLMLDAIADKLPAAQLPDQLTVQHSTAALVQLLSDVATQQQISGGAK